MNSEVAASPLGPVVAGVDGSRRAAAVVDLAAAEAVRRGAPLLVVHVWPGRCRGVFRGGGVVASRADGRHLLDALKRPTSRITAGAR